MRVLNRYGHRFIGALAIGMLLLVPNYAQAQSASVCDGYARDFAQRHSRGGVAGGAARGAIGGGLIGGIVGGGRGARRGAAHEVD